MLVEQVLRERASGSLKGSRHVITVHNRHILEIQLPEMEETARSSTVLRLCKGRKNGQCLQKVGLVAGPKVA